MGFEDEFFERNPAEHTEVFDDAGQFRTLASPTWVRNSTGMLLLTTAKREAVAAGLPSGLRSLLPHAARVDVLVAAMSHQRVGNGEYAFSDALVAARVGDPQRRELLVLDRFADPTPSDAHTLGSPLRAARVVQEQSGERRSFRVEARDGASLLLTAAGAGPAQRTAGETKLRSSDYSTRLVWEGHAMPCQEASLRVEAFKVLADADVDPKPRRASWVEQLCMAIYWKPIDRVPDFEMTVKVRM